MWLGKTLNRRARLYQALATALDAGLGIEQALELAFDRPQRLPVEWLSDVIDREDRIPRFEARILRAAETAGVLPEILTQLSKFLEKRAAALRQLAARLAYPVLLLHAAVILPNLRRLVSGDIGDFLGSVVPALLVLWGVGASVGVVLIWSRSMVRKSPAFAIASRGLPVVGGLIQSSGAGTYSHVLSLLLAAGVPLGSALKDSAQCCGNAELNASGLRITEQVIDRGEALHTAFQREARTWPRLLIESIRTGEATGKLEETLAGAARGLHQEADRRVDLLLTVVPILVYLLAAAYVAWIVITTFTGIYSAI